MRLTRRKPHVNENPTSRINRTAFLSNAVVVATKLKAPVYYLPESRSATKYSHCSIRRAEVCIDPPRILPAVASSGQKEPYPWRALSRLTSAFVSSGSVLVCFRAWALQLPSTSSAPFTVSASTAPTITSFSPAIGTPGTGLTITGTNFETTVSNDGVTLNNRYALVNSATSTSISTNVPSLGTSGRISVATPAGKATSAVDFFVPPLLTRRRMWESLAEWYLVKAKR